jgi:hypothetical protein
MLKLKKVTKNLIKINNNIEWKSEFNKDALPVFTFNQFNNVIKKKEQVKNTSEELHLEIKSVNEMFEKEKKLMQKEGYDDSIDILMQLTDVYPQESLYQSCFKGRERLVSEEFNQALNLNKADYIAREHFKDKKPVTTEANRVPGQNKNKPIFKGKIGEIFKKAGKIKIVALLNFEKRGDKWL